MGALGRGLRMSPWMSKMSKWACGCALLALPAFGQTLPEPPVNSDIAFRILPARYSQAQVETEVLQEQPLLRLIFEGGGSLLGVDPVWDLLETFDGTVLGAVLSDPKRGSNLNAYFQDSELRSERETVVSELQSLASDLESYKIDNETYPEDYKKFLDEFRYYDASLPEGVSYRYERTNGGKGFRLYVFFEKPSRLGELGPAPVFGSDSYTEHLTPTKAAVPLDFALAVKVKNSQAAKAIADGLWGPSEGGLWRSGNSLVATLRGPWFVVSDRQQNLGPFFASLNGKAPGWSKNPAFVRVAKNLDMNAPISAFVNIPRLSKAVAAALPSEATKMLALLGPSGYTVTPGAESQCRMEAFVGVTAPKGSELESFFAQSAGADPQAALMADSIPWDVSNAFAADYRKSKQLLNALVALSPEVEADYQNAQDVWAGFLGLDAAKGFDNLVDGWAVLSFERIDMFVGAFEDLTSAAEAVPPEDPIPDEGTGGPEAEGTESVIGPDGEMVTPSSDSETTAPVELEAQPTESAEEVAEAVAEEAVTEEAVTEEAGVEEAVAEEAVVDEAVTDPTKPARIPFTVAFQVADPQAREALAAALKNRLGETSQTKTVHGFEVQGREDGLLSYATQDNWFYISGGKTQRLLRNLLAVASGAKPSLTSLESWNRFRSDQRGQVVAIGHQKVDGMYSMVKGALLFLGPDFRPLAYELGKLRDYHSAAFVVPDGMLFVGELLQGDGR